MAHDPMPWQGRLRHRARPGPRVLRAVVRPERESLYVVERLGRLQFRASLAHARGKLAQESADRSALTTPIEGGRP